MFGKIFSKEIKQQFTSLTMIILIAAIFLFYYTQFLGDIKRQGGINPVPYRTADEMVTEHDEFISMEAFVRAIYNVMKNDLNNGETVKIDGIAKKYEKISDEQKEALKKAMKELEEKSFQLNLMEYSDLLNDVNESLGRNTVYQEKSIQSFVRRNYKEDAKKYNAILKEDNITNAYGRIFADYIGMAVGFFAVFVTAFTFVKDRRYNSHKFIYSSQVSSAKYVTAKYLADLFSILILVLIVAAHATWEFHKFSKITGDPISYIGFFKYTIFWILPTIMFVTSFSYVLQLIFNNGIVPIVIQFIYYQYSVLPLQCDSIIKYILRFNRVAPYSEYKPFQDIIIKNRIFFVIFSIVLLFAAIKLWDRKRGNLDDKFKLRKKAVS